MRGVTGPDALEVGRPPRRARNRVLGQRGRDVHRVRALDRHTGEPGLDDRQADVVGTGDERPFRRRATSRGHHRLLHEPDTLPPHLSGGRIEVLD